MAHSFRMNTVFYASGGMRGTRIQGTPTPVIASTLHDKRVVLRNTFDLRHGSAVPTDYVNMNEDIENGELLVSPRFRDAELDSYDIALNVRSGKTRSHTIKIFSPAANVREYMIGDNYNQALDLTVVCTNAVEYDKGSIMILFLGRECLHVLRITLNMNLQILFL
ncbi:hypothetical protein QE152_g25553 [Popillia japonica]|uniref:Uncharacterized protein n=1 Tax=Popillia japonica TaxID=7064 RepID=A0AAW1K0E7_POPJA